MFTDDILRLLRGRWRIPCFSLRIFCVSRPMQALSFPVKWSFAGLPEARQLSCTLQTNLRLLLLCTLFVVLPTIFGLPNGLCWASYHRLARWKRDKAIPRQLKEFWEWSLPIQNSLHAFDLYTIWSYCRQSMSDRSETCVLLRRDQSLPRYTRFRKGQRQFRYIREAGNQDSNHLTVWWACISL